MKVIFMKKTFIETFLEYMEDSYEQPLEEKHLKYAKEDFGYISPYVDGSQWNLEDIKEFSFHYIIIDRYVQMYIFHIYGNTD